MLINKGLAVSKDDFRKGAAEQFYDVMIEPHDRKGNTYILEFKVLDADVFSRENIRKYGFAFQGKSV